MAAVQIPGGLELGESCGTPELGQKVDNGTFDFPVYSHSNHTISE